MRPPDPWHRTGRSLPGRVGRQRINEPPRCLDGQREVGCAGNPRLRRTWLDPWPLADPRHEAAEKPARRSRIPAGPRKTPVRGREGSAVASTGIESGDRARSAPFRETTGPMPRRPDRRLPGRDRRGLSGLHTGRTPGPHRSADAPRPERGSRERNMRSESSFPGLGQHGCGGAR